MLSDLTVSLLDGRADAFRDREESVRSPNLKKVLAPDRQQEVIAELPIRVTLLGDFEARLFSRLATSEVVETSTIQKRHTR